MREGVRNGWENHISSLYKTPLRNSENLPYRKRLPLEKIYPHQPLHKKSFFGAKSQSCQQINIIIF